LAPKEKFASQHKVSDTGKLSDSSSRRIFMVLLRKLASLPAVITTFTNLLLVNVIRVAYPRYYIEYNEFGHTTEKRREQWNDSRQKDR
jgi:hypothetical protein